MNKILEIKTARIIISVIFVMILLGPYPLLSQGSVFEQGMVTICFDDGRTEVYTLALDVLERYGIKTTQYIVTGLVGTNPLYWMDWNQVKKLKKYGHEIASHTVTHPHLTMIPIDSVRMELKDSKLTLMDCLGLDNVYSFASPYGDYNEKVVNEVKKYYKSHRSCNWGYNNQNVDPYHLKCMYPDGRPGGHTPEIVKGWINHAQTEKLWLIITFHEIIANKPHYSTQYNVKNFEEILRYLYTIGIRIITVKEGVNILTTTGGGSSDLLVGEGLDKLTRIEDFDASISYFPKSFSLKQNYPNPFNPSTRINFSIPGNGSVSLKVYNSLGQEVNNLVDEQLSRGLYEVDFNGSNLNSGVYFYALQYMSIEGKYYTDTKKLLLIK